MPHVSAKLTNCIRHWCEVLHTPDTSIRSSAISGKPLIPLRLAKFSPELLAI
jgi:hypothetical protein